MGKYTVEFLEKFMKERGPRFEVLKEGDPFLRTKCAPVAETTSTHKRLCDLMLHTMDAEQGIGLAAPQVGIGLRVLVMRDVTPTGNKRGMLAYYMVNPEIIEREGFYEEEEGCLSMPEKRCRVMRNKKVKVRYTAPHEFEEDGYLVKERSFEGLSAACVQHEVDHLDGILMTDRQTDG